MSYTEILLLSLALSVDAITVGSVVGVRHRGIRPVFRIAFHFGLFQALFPLAGAIVGSILLRWVDMFDHWIIFSVFTILGLRMIVEALLNDPQKVLGYDLTRGWSMLGLSVAVSIDALAAGLTLNRSVIPLGWTVTIIGSVTAILTTISMIYAHSLGRLIGRSAGILGGVILIGLGVKTLING